MKLDRVLTMGECLASWYGGVSCVKPPADDARHVPVAAQDDVEIRRQRTTFAAAIDGGTSVKIASVLTNRSAAKSRNFSRRNTKARSNQWNTRL